VLLFHSQKNDKSTWHSTQINPNLKLKKLLYNWFCKYCTCLGWFWWTITDRSSRIRVHVHASGYNVVRETVWWSKRTRRLHKGVQLRVLDWWCRLGVVSMNIATPWQGKNLFSVSDLCLAYKLREKFNVLRNLQNMYITKVYIIIRTSTYNYNTLYNYHINSSR